MKYFLLLTNRSEMKTEMTNYKPEIVMHQDVLSHSPARRENNKLNKKG